MKAWLLEAAGAAPTNADLATACVEEMRKRKVIVPGPTTVERLCSAGLVLAERKAIPIIAERLDADMRDRLEKLITETADGRVSRFVRLRRIETGANTADMGRLFDRLDVIEGLGMPADLPARRSSGRSAPTSDRPAAGRGRAPLCRQPEEDADRQAARHRRRFGR